MNPTTLRTLSAHGLALVALAALPAAAQSPAPAESGAPTALVPGELPAAASEPARALFTALVRAVSGEAQGAIRAFDLSFAATTYSGEKQTNDFDLRYLYLDPGWVRMVLESGRERLRGRRGDFLVDNSGVYELKGKDYAEDRRELDETVAVSRLIVGLSDPGKLRLASLAVLPAAPAGLPVGRLSEKATELDWIVLESPDFRGRPDGSAPTLDRVELGLDRESHLPLLAVVTDPAEPRSAVLARLKEYQPLDGYRVPWDVTTWRVAEGQSVTGPAGGAQREPPAFAEKPAIRLWLKQGKLRPRLEPKDFEPPQ